MRSNSSGSEAQPDPKDSSSSEDGPLSASQIMEHTLYEELRKLAAAKMAQERPDHTLQATALVHEAYIRLVDVDKAQHWDSRGHFFVAAAEAMRRILVEQARRKSGPSAGGGLERFELYESQLMAQSNPTDMLALHEALEALEAKDARAAQLVNLRFFAGLTNEQAASVLGVTPRTAYADWVYEKSWLRLQLAAGD